MGIFKKKDNTPRCSAVILAAGSSERMGTDKAMMDLGGMPVLARTLLAFQDCPLVDDIIVVTRMEMVMEIAGLCKKYGIGKASQVITGGATRAESALAGVSAVRCSARLIAIHDGARPLVTKELIQRTVYAARDSMAAVPVIQSTDTLKAVDDKGFVTGTVDRAHTVRVQTPQIFDADLIKGALTKAADSGAVITDDCSAIERLGVRVATVEGEMNNIKLTTPGDMLFATAVLKDRGEFHAYRAWV